MKAFIWQVLVAIDAVYMVPLTPIRWVIRRFNHK